ncbi:MAG: UDP-glucose 4-epimerase GalE [Lentimicrobiaceae bacterium]|nr:UDP-glucose 4-epimerase GalE [Lentimicrobiaceae bacterium]MCP4910176.1 UDP-glucose 4-epimerase GalE [Bacteroidota bacterium]MBT3453789.1 UDP-glucose 4-epimerase GalE [Lentimicrobiaceae bacterium]MBT3819468.1 UDP-glucose 4-epimerase GalE [Lentimicrobiaceae bacterium]MBT4061609.1 UDP-glucose 4-epimerase GalE [Lentimicrobiaceae bacterium]
MPMKILVTGGTGYIGSHTVVELQAKGFEVVIVDNLSNSSSDIVEKISEISGIIPKLEIFDLTNKDLVADFFSRNNDIVGIIHFAAYKAVGESVNKPLLYYRNNIESLINVMEGMQTNGIENIVFSSSCTVYGQPDVLPVNEQAPIKIAESPYGNTKQISEEIIQDTVKSSNINAIALRYFNPIGAHETALIGELPLGVPNNLMPFITQTAIGIRKCLSVFGDDYPTPDGTAIRDYIHVVDLAKAHVIAIDRMISKNMKDDLEIFNLGTGNGYSVLEVINSFERVSGLKLNYQIVGRREGDIIQVWADPTYSNEELGWKAEMGIDEMTNSAWNWEQFLSKKK